MKSYKKSFFAVSPLIVIVLICHTVQCAIISSSEPNDNNLDSSRTGRKEDHRTEWTKSSKIAGKIVGQCMEMADNAAVAECFAVKTIAGLDRASRMNSINILPGISFVVNDDLTAEEQQQRHSRALLSEQLIENQLTSDNDQSADKSGKIIDMLIDSVGRFLRTHSLQLRVPKSVDLNLERALEEGRGKLKKKLLPFVGLLALKIFAVLPLLLGTVGFLALKALLIGKIALIIAGILALQKYSSSASTSGLGWGKLTDSFGVPSNVGWSGGASSPGGAGYYRRSIDTGAHELAYSAQIPTQENISSESSSSS